MKKGALIILLVAVNTLVYSATLQELREKEQDLYGILSEYWIDKEKGELHLGDKESAEVQFSLSESFMKRLTPDQLKSSINTALSKFEQEKKDAYINAIAPFLNDLTTVRNELKVFRTKLDTAAATLAHYLGKSSQTIMQLPIINIKNLVGVLPADKKVELGKKVNLEEFDHMRAAFDIKVAKSTSSGVVEEESFAPTVLPAALKGKSSNYASSRTRVTDYDDSDDDY